MTYGVRHTPIICLQYSVHAIKAERSPFLAHPASTRYWQGCSAGHDAAGHGISVHASDALASDRHRVCLSLVPRSAQIAGASFQFFAAMCSRAGVFCPTFTVSSGPSAVNDFLWGQ